MSWYCAHAIFYFELKDEPQDSYLIWENVFLVEAPSDDEARSKAEKYARADEESSSNDLKLNDKPCLYRFGGIRKLITVSYIEESSGRPDDVPVSGAEVTYSQFVVNTLDDVIKLSKGDMVDVLYRE
jgi:hypothetical protein